MAAVGRLGRHHGADLKVWPEEEKTAKLVVAGLCTRRHVNAARHGQSGICLIGTNAVVRWWGDAGPKLDAKTTAGRTPLDEALRGVTNADGAAGEANDG